jgi:hypothetical protein
MPVSVPDRQEWFSEDAGFEHPSWPAIEQWIEAHVPPKELNDAWIAVARHWLQRIRKRLGDTFHLAESENFHLLSALDPRRKKATLRFLESALGSIRTSLGDLASTDYFGKHACIVFQDEDRYYRYISHFFPDGEHAGSGGMCLGGDYTHIVVPSDEVGQLQRVLVHELSHNSVVHLPLPVWLNEGVAMILEEAVSGSVAYTLDRETADRHRAFWDAATIQQFWEGSSWGLIGDGNELSYGLAQILMRIFYEDVRPGPEKFRDFVRDARSEDAGQQSMRKHFDLSLGELAAEFLGDGDWEPQPAKWTNLPNDA